MFAAVGPWWDRQIDGRTDTVLFHRPADPGLRILCNNVCVTVTDMSHCVGRGMCTSVGSLNVSGVGAVPAQHVRLHDPVTRDRYIIGHLTGMFKRVGEACSGVAYR